MAIKFQNWYKIIVLTNIMVKNLSLFIMYQIYIKFGQIFLGLKCFIK